MDQRTLAKLELELERKIYRNSYYEFYKAAFKELHPIDVYNENWHAKYICDILQEEFWRVKNNIPREKDIIINVPPRSSKSMICTVIWPIWCWTIEPSFIFLRCSYSDEIATGLNRKSKDLINTQWFQRLYGSKIQLRKDLSGAGHFANLDGGEMYAFGLDGTVTGKGGQIIIADDPQNPKEANSEKERENAKLRWNETISNRLNQQEIGGRIIVMQRLHLLDIPGFLLDPRDGRPEDMRHICIPAELDMNLIKPPELAQYYQNGLFWPSKFSQRVLDGFKKAGSLYFAGQFQQTPVPVEGNLFKRAWIDILEPENVSRNANESPINFFLDTAYTEDETKRNDPTGILCAFRKGDVIYVMNFVEVWMEFPKLIKFIKEYVYQNGYTPTSRVFIEPKANGKSVAQQLRSETGLNIIEIDSDFIKDDKVTRATSVSPMVEARKLKMIHGDWNDKYLGYLVSFPKAQHDEAVDLTVYCLNYLMPINDFLYEIM